MNAPREAPQTHPPGSGCETLDSTFKAVASYLPRALVSATALDRILKLTQQLPAALTGYAGLECRLAAGVERVDAIVEISREAGSILAGRNSSLDLPTHFRADSAWQRVARFAQSWLDPQSPLYWEILGTWLEFDLDRAPARTPVPGFFLRFEGGWPRRRSLPEAVKYRILTEHALPILLGRAPRTAVKAALRNCIEGLPQGARLSEAGLMMQRDADAAEIIRLCFKNPPEQELPAYLAGIGWPGNPRELAATLAEFSTAATGPGQRSMRVGYIDVDVGATIQPTIGIEYFLETSGRQLVSGPVERDWLAGLLQHGLNTPEKHDGLLAWPGYSLTRLSHQLWPSIVVRHTNHIKLVHTPNQPLSAKAYLAFYHRYFKRGASTNPAAEAVNVALQPFTS